MIGRICSGLILATFFPGCVTKPESVEVWNLRKQPVELTVEIKAANEEFKSAPHRYTVTLAVIAPQERGGKILHYVLDGVVPAWRGFLTVGSKWRIQSDEEAFEQEAAMGFSFWAMNELQPEPVDPGQAPALRPPSSLVAGSVVAADELDHPMRGVQQRIAGYAEEYFKARFVGNADVQILIAENGAVTVEKILAASSEEHGRLAAQMVEAFSFDPPRLGGIWVRVRLVFRIRSNLEGMTTDFLDP